MSVSAVRRFSSKPKLGTWRAGEGVSKATSEKPNRRASLARRMSLDPTKLLSGIAGGKSKDEEVEGITFEAFATEFFKMMVKKKKSDDEEVSDPNVRGVQIEFSNLCLQIKLGGKDFDILKNVNGKIQEKTMVGLMGGSGAGKTR